MSKIIGIEQTQQHKDQTQNFEKSSISPKLLKKAQDADKTEKRAEKLARSTKKDPSSRSRKDKTSNHKERQLLDERREIHDFRTATKQGQVQSRSGKNTKGTAAVVSEEEEGISPWIDPNLSEEEAIKERIKFAISEPDAQSTSLEDRTESIEDKELNNSYASAIRTESNLGYLDAGFAAMLDNIIDFNEYLQSRAEISSEEDRTKAQALQAQILEFSLLKKKKKKTSELTTEDSDTLILVHYLPVIYDAINFIIEKGISDEELAKMESLKGEISALVRTAAEPDSPLHELFKQIKAHLEEREKVEWYVA